MMMFLSKAWVWIKSYWFIPLILVAAAGAFLLRRKKAVDWAKVMDFARNSHKKEVAAIEKAHADEIAKRNAVLKRQQEARAAIEAEYKRNQREIDKKKKKEIERVLRKTKNDPQAMADELHKSTGFRIVVVE